MLYIWKEMIMNDTSNNDSSELDPLAAFDVLFGSQNLNLMNLRAALLFEWITLPEYLTLCREMK